MKKKDDIKKGIQYTIARLKQKNRQMTATIIRHANEDTIRGNVIYENEKEIDELKKLLEDN